MTLITMTLILSPSKDEGAAALSKVMR